MRFLILALCALFILPACDDSAAGGSKAMYFRGIWLQGHSPMRRFCRTLHRCRWIGGTNLSSKACLTSRCFAVIGRLVCALSERRQSADRKRSGHAQP